MDLSRDPSYDLIMDSCDSGICGAVGKEEAGPGRGIHCCQKQNNNNNNKQYSPGRGKALWEIDSEEIFKGLISSTT
jgi:hypothetical protein